MEYLRSLLFNENFVESMPSKTMMEVEECSRCGVWIPEEKLKWYRRKKKTRRETMCKPCRAHMKKCRLSKSAYY